MREFPLGFSNRFPASARLLDRVSLGGAFTITAFRSSGHDGSLPGLSFSIASGFISWFLAAPLLLLGRKTPAKGEKLWWLGWISIGTAGISLYFRGYAQPAVHPSAWEAWKHPFRAIQFVLAYLGTPFLGTVPEPSPLAPVASAALLILLAVCLCYLWNSRRDGALLARALPWVLLAGLAVVNAFLTMLGRLGFGALAATQSRYVSFAIMFPIGLLFLTALVFGHWCEHSGSKVATASKGRNTVAVMIAILGTALAILFVCGTIKSLESWKRFQHNCLAGKAALLLVNVIDEPDILAHHVHWAVPQLKGWANTLDRMGYLRPALVRSNRIRGIASQTTGEQMGALNELHLGPGTEVAASGWAILPSSHRVADGVLLTYDDAQGEPVIFALAEVVSERAEVSEHLQDTAYLRCGWRKTWEPTRIPAGSQWIRAWAFDAEHGRAYHIGAALLDAAKAVP